MKNALLLLACLCFIGCASNTTSHRGKKVTPAELETLKSDFRLFALETIIKEKQAIDAEAAKRADRKDRWNDLDSTDQPKKDYLVMWTEYFKDFKNLDQQWCYGLKAGEDESLIEYIVEKRRALGLQEIKR